VGSEMCIRDREREAYAKCRKLFEKCPDLCGVYVTTEASIPVLNAAGGANALQRLTIIATDLFLDLVSRIRSGAVAATIYQRPRAQGQMAFRMLHEFLAEGVSQSHRVALGDARKSGLLSAGRVAGRAQGESRSIPGNNRRSSRRFRLAATLWKAK